MSGLYERATSEQKARQNIAQLSAAQSGAIRELQPKGFPADYILFADDEPLGTLAAKKEGSTLSHVAEQSERYSHAHKWIPRRWADPLPFTLRTHQHRDEFP